MKRILSTAIILLCLHQAIVSRQPRLPALEAYNIRNAKAPTLIHLSVPRLRQLIMRELKNFGVIKSDKFNSMFRDIVTRERYHTVNRGYYVLYHAFDKALLVPQDLYKRLYMALYKYPRRGSWENFRFLRFFDGATMSVSDYLIDMLEHKGLVFDVDPDVKRVLLSANPSLFGNIGRPAECTFTYFMEPRSHITVDEGFFGTILDLWPLPAASREQYIQELMDLTQWFTQEADKRQPSSNILVQLFFPKDIVNKSTYISWWGGIPMEDELVQWIRNEVIAQKKRKAERPFLAAAQSVKKALAQERDQNPIYNKLVEAVRTGQFRTSDFLDQYMKRPQELINMGKKPGETLNALQARVFFSQEVLDPQKGVLMYTYDLIDDDVRHEYESRLQDITDRIIREVMEQKGVQLEN